jgi:hypothetical protein
MPPSNVASDLFLLAGLYEDSAAVREARRWSFTHSRRGSSTSIRLTRAASIPMSIKPVPNGASAFGLVGLFSWPESLTITH